MTAIANAYFSISSAEAKSRSKGGWPLNNQCYMGKQCITYHSTGRCAMRPRSAGDFYVRPHRSSHYRPFDNRN
jgi:hypothetical protein